MSTPSSGGNKKLGLSQLQPVPSLSLKSWKNDIPASDDQDFPKLRLKPVNGVPCYRATWQSPTLLSHEFKQIYHRVELIELAQ